MRTVRARRLFSRAAVSEESRQDAKSRADHRNEPGKINRAERPDRSGGPQASREVIDSMQRQQNWEGLAGLVYMKARVGFAGERADASALV